MAPFRRICLTGAESTGKSTLAQIAGDRYRAAVSPEFAREYALRVARPLEYADVEAIARGQIAGEDRAFERAYGLGILDTDLLSTVAYSRHYYDACPGWIEHEARRRRADLYLLLHVDVAWMDDPARDAQADRHAIHARFVSTLDEFGVRYELIGGDWIERQNKVLAAIQAAL